MTNDMRDVKNLLITEIAAIANNANQAMQEVISLADHNCDTGKHPTDTREVRYWLVNASRRLEQANQALELYRKASNGEDVSIKPIQPQREANNAPPAPPVTNGGARVPVTPTPPPTPPNDGEAAIPEQTLEEDWQEYREPSVDF